MENYLFEYIIYAEKLNLVSPYILYINISVVLHTQTYITTYINLRIRSIERNNENMKLISINPLESKLLCTEMKGDQEITKRINTTNA